ncbi:F-box/kelch-repeat protein At3g23880-like [Silene latifolia]|uniref:F-box/kelch-repeat protein At3g23880-like n=1 Tax=Silene latifolia TaxID=37657 RepID=UPI003D76AC58
MKSRRRKKAKSSSSSSNSNKPSESKYLPPEVWTLIFLSLPAKTLLKSRCVCKYWCSIIDNPNFMNMHFKLCKINSGNTTKLLVALQGLGYHGKEGCLLTIRDAETLEETDRIFSKSDLYKYYIIGSCNGLLLVGQNGFCSIREELRLWNPSIRKSLVIPACPVCPHQSSLIDRGWYLFGLAPDTQDYKVVKFTFGFNPDEKLGKLYAAVYTLSNQRWTNRIDPVNVSFLNTYNWYWLFNSLSTGVYFQGSAYWLGRNDKGSSGLLTHLGSFDFDTENITLSELPFSVDETGSLRFLFLLGKSLAVFSISELTSNIWVLKQKNRKETWALWFFGQSSRDGYELFNVHDGSTKKIFYCDRDSGYFVYGNKAYNIVSCQVHELNNSMRSSFKLEEYSDSLVLSKEYKARDLRDYP